jgi:hypothetical protein
MPALSKAFNYLAHKAADALVEGAITLIDEMDKQSGGNGIRRNFQP